MDKKLNHIKNVLHGFFLAIGTTIAEPNTILPLIISHFGGGSVLIGLYSALLKGGAVIVQLYAAFHAQSYPHMQKYLRRVFLVRFLAWFFIGISIVTLGNNHPNLTLFCIGLGLFLFSFSAGFGAIYFRETVAKIFTHKFRGKSMATRQFFAAFASIISGAAAGYILQTQEAPYSYGILFIVSTFLMGIGYTAFGLIDEPIKEKISKKEKSFKEFLKNSYKLLKADKVLQNQIFTFFFAYSYLFALPFIILDAKQSITLDGNAIGTLITVQMIGAMISNLIWGRFSARGLNKLIVHIILSIFIVAIILALIGGHLYIYMAIFFLIGAAADGSRIASGNLLVIISPEDKRPIYTALKTNIVSLGIFFPIVGGAILSLTSFSFLYIFTITLLIVSLVASFYLVDK